MGTRDRVVLVRAEALEDLLDLSSRALDDVDDVMRSALSGAIADVRAHSLMDDALIER